MNIPECELTIVVPAKNEKLLLPQLLESLCRQDYLQTRPVKVFVADANSTDGTPELALAFRDRLDIEVIPGGLPSVGRNAGAARANSRFVLFIDADMDLADPSMVRRAVGLARSRRLHCVTTNIWCPAGTLRDHLLYIANDMLQYASILLRPFSTGMFMLFDRKKFLEFGGFHEQAMYAEDYLLSKKVSPARFGIVRGRVSTTNRRFRNMGHMKIVKMFLKTAANTFNDDYFLQDQGYWQSKA